MTRILNTHDIPIILVELVQNPPWTRRKDGEALIVVKTETLIYTYRVGKMFQFNPSLPGYQVPKHGSPTAYCGSTKIMPSLATILVMFSITRLTRLFK